MVPLISGIFEQKFERDCHKGDEAEKGKRKNFNQNAASLKAIPRLNLANTTGHC